MEQTDIVVIGGNEEERAGLAERLQGSALFVDIEGFRPEKVYKKRPRVLFLFQNENEKETLDACRAIKGTPELNDIPIILVIPENGPSGSVEWSEFPVDDVITEPFDRRELAIRVRSLKEKRKAVIRASEIEARLDKTTERMKEKMYLLTTLFIVGEKLKEHLEPAEIYRAIRNILSGIADVKCFSIYLFDEERKFLLKVTSRSVKRPIPERLPLEGVAAPLKGVVESEAAFLLGQEGSSDAGVSVQIEGSNFFGLPLLAVLPIKTANTFLGVINIHEFKESAAKKIDFNLLTILTAQVASAIYNCRLHQKIEDYVTKLDLTNKKLEKSTMSLDEQMFHLNTITLFSSQFHSTCYKLDEVHEVIRDLLVNFIGAETFHVLYFEEGTYDRYTGAADGVAKEVKANLDPNRFKTVTEKVMRTAEPFFLPDLKQDKGLSGAVSVGNLPIACLPLMLEEKPRGVIIIETLLPQKKGFTNEDYELLSLLAQEAALALLTGHLYPKVQTRVITDPNTGLYNHTHFQRCVDLEFIRARRYKSLLSFILIDVDDFKKINTAHGHLIGDSVLVDIARILNVTRKDIDSLARYGAEEFGVLLPQTSLEGAVILAERIREMVEVFDFHGKEETIRATVSIGVSSFPRQKTKEGLINSAEASLLEAKRQGKNRVKFEE